MTHSNQLKMARCIVDDCPELIEMDAFDARDLETSKPGALIPKLKNMGLITKRGSVRIPRREYENSHSGETLHIWEWSTVNGVDLQEYMRDYLERRKELPCGCRAHIPAHTDDDGRYICEHCEAKHNREIVANAL